MFPTLKIRDMNVKLPIIQGGMGIGVSMSKLAAAVANEGGSELFLVLNQVTKKKTLEQIMLLPTFRALSKNLEKLENWLQVALLGLIS